MKLDRLEKLVKLDRLEKLVKLDRLEKLVKLDRLEKLDGQDKQDQLDKLDGQVKLDKLDGQVKLDKQVLQDRLVRLDKLVRLVKLVQRVIQVVKMVRRCRGILEWMFRITTISGLAMLPLQYRQVKSLSLTSDSSTILMSLRITRLLETLPYQLRLRHSIFATTVLVSVRQLQCLLVIKEVRLSEVLQLIQVIVSVF